MVANRESVFEQVRMRGPSLPNDVKKVLGSDTMIVGAIMSELVHSGRLRVSNMKVGGSPLYFVPGHENRLQDYSKFLNEKDKQAYDLLREKRVLRDSAMTPLMRVSLRNIKDFAKPVEVKSGEKQELFWKWYLIANEQASVEIKKELGIEHAAPHSEVPKPSQTMEKKQDSKESAKDKDDQAEKSEQAHLKRQDTFQKQFPSQFIADVNSFFAHNNIEVVEEKIVKKSTESDYVIRIPSPVGKLMYFCKAKSKKKVNHADLSAAYVQGESKKLPVLFLTKGELNKKARGMLDNEFKNMTVQNF